MTGIPSLYIAPCSKCGKAVALTTSRSEIICHECRQMNPPKPKPPWIPRLMQCRCGQIFTQHRYGQKYCCPEHRPGWENRPPNALAKTAERGYGGQHRKALAQAKRDYVPGQPCAEDCGLPIWPGQPVHLAHDHVNGGYKGLAHRECNLREANIRNARMSVAPRPSVVAVVTTFATSRPW